jgi:hypothetical protein
MLGWQRTWRRKMETAFNLRLLLTSVLVVGCSDELLSPSLRRNLEGEIEIRVAEDTVLLRRTSAAAWFSATGVVRNGTDRLLYLERCGTIAQRQIESRWVTVWAQPCATSVSPAEITAGSSQTLRIDVVGFTTTDWSPELDARMTAGVYRLLLPIGSSVSPSGNAVTLPEEVRASRPFVVREATK